MNNELIYLETHVLQKDMRIRLPKCILSNIDAERGITQFDIYLDQINQCIVLKKKKVQ
jgi:hypothetical protein